MDYVEFELLLKYIGCRISTSSTNVKKILSITTKQIQLFYVKFLTNKYLQFQRIAKKPTKCLKPALFAS